MWTGNSTQWRDGWQCKVFLGLLLSGIRVLRVLYQLFLIKWITNSSLSMKISQLLTPVRNCNGWTSNTQHLAENSHVTGSCVRHRWGGSRLSPVTFGNEVVDIGSWKFMKTKGLIVMFLKNSAFWENGLLITAVMCSILLLAETDNNFIS